MAANQKQEKGWFGGLGKDDKKLLTDLKQEVQKLGKAVEDLATNAGEGQKPIQIQFSWPMDNELMQLVREILARLPGEGGEGLSAAEEDEQAARLNASTDQVQAAVDANQP